MHLSRAIALTLSIAFSGTAALAAAADLSTAPSAPDTGNTAPSLAAPVVSTTIAQATDMQPAPSTGASFKINPLPDRNLGPNDLALDGLDRKSVV